jgi:hemolysin III
MSARAQTVEEEIANSVSHGIGLLATLVATPFLVLTAVPHGAMNVVGVSIFAATAAGLYLTSTVYHALPHGRAKRVLRLVDHGAIYLLIAGTYTPFTLGVLRGGWGWTLLGVIWSLALAGLIFKTLVSFRYPILSTVIYLAMGWLVIIALYPLIQRMPIAGLLWLLAGGLVYSGGIGFYVAKQVRYAHFAWHLCVLAGTACHFVAVIGYSA